MAIMIDMPNSHRSLEAVPDAVVVTDHDGVIVFVNRLAENMTGYRRSELVGREVEVLVPAPKRAIHMRHRRAFYKRGVARPMGDASTDLSLRRKDGSEISVEISLGRVGADTVAVIRDETERHHMEAALEHRALHDPLTDLANRTLFFDRLRQSINSARRDGSQVALVILDLDGFKSINDTRGHGVGDEVLKMVAARLRLGQRATDTAARLGGDEFAWILPRVTTRRSVDGMIRKRLQVAQQPIVVGDEPIEIRISAGSALYPEDGRSPDELMRHADAAMYAAKHRHRKVVLE